MKILFFLICLIIGYNIQAQTCQTSLLFKKGTILEYKNFMPTLLSSKFLEFTRLVFVVEDVRDSNNITYSYIRKTGIHPENEELKYYRNYVLRCDGNTIFIPFDFYNLDTIFFSNMYPASKKDKGIYKSTILKGKCDFQFPVDFQQNKFEISNRQIVMDIKTRSVASDGGRRGFTVGRMTEGENSVETKIKEVNTYGKESITTAAGSYECNKLMFVWELHIFKKPTDVNMILHFNPEVGVVRSNNQEKYAGAYMELVKVSTLSDKITEK